jgi:tetratricopeptide (TPR) repeat protein
MKKPLLLSIFSFSVLLTASQEKSCTEIISPQLSEIVKKDFQQKLFEAKVIYEKDSSNADAIIWYGRRTAYLGDYMKAIEIFTRGIRIHPDDARMYRHRGHRYITVRCFDKAIIDFKKASRQIKGKPDETEPDGLPNAKNIPTSTLQSNIWYHLGLAYYLKGDYKKAVKAYRECLVVSNNPDMYVATANWMYISLLKVKKTKDAQKLLSTIKTNEELLESGDYLKILLLYRQQTDMNDPTREIENNTTLSSVSYGFGLGNYLLERGKKEQAKNIFQKVVSGNQWSSFGFIAAEKALAEFK